MAAALTAFAPDLTGGIARASAQAPAPSGAPNAAQARSTSAPYPPPRPFDLAPAQPAPFIRTSPAAAPSASEGVRQGTAPDVQQAPDTPARLVTDAPLPPPRAGSPATQSAQDDEDDDEAPAPPTGTWPRRTPGQSDLLFEPRPSAEDEIRANGITTDPGTSVTCLPPPLKRVLSALVERYGGVRVTSTFRPAWRARRNSFHRRCEAVDFRVPGETPRNVLDFVKTLPDTGGHKVYWNGLVHVDVGPWRSW